MRKIILIMAGSLLLSVAASQAQDTMKTRNRIQQPQYPQPQIPQPQIQQPQQNQQLPTQYRSDNMIVMPQDKLPESLRQTLRGTEYQGWEKSTIYQNPATGEYLLDMTQPTAIPNNPNPNPNAAQNPSRNNPPQIYRFDRYGRVIKENKTGAGNDQ